MEVWSLYYYCQEDASYVEEMLQLYPPKLDVSSQLC